MSIKAISRGLHSEQEWVEVVYGSSVGELYWQYWIS